MRDPIHVLKSLEENATKPGYLYQRLYRNLYNPEFYLLAYKNIAASQGSMTAGADGNTLDNMSMARIQRIIATLQDDSYQPTPARREYIAKKNNPAKKRPLGIPSTDDRLIQEIIRMILEAIYEPTFSKYSHGFRPRRSCHTALLQIQNQFTSVKWFVEGDIKACFDSFDHHVLTNLLRRRIADERFICLMWKFLRAGYMEQWTHHYTYSGSPQGSGMSPILANIYLSELDAFVEEYKQCFDMGDCRTRKATSAYRSQEYQVRKARVALKLKRNPQNIATFKGAQKKLLASNLYPVIDPSFVKIQYSRYADDFIIGVIGSKGDAERIKAGIKDFLQSKLKLTLSDEKTKVTHSSDWVRFLGYDITVSRDKSVMRDKKGVLRRVWYGNVKLYVPYEKWVGKLLEYQVLRIVKSETGKELWKPRTRSKLVNRTKIEIISKYNAEIRGLYNFYRLANNVSVLSKFAFIMEGSMLKTFAAKGHSSAKQMRLNHTKNGILGVDYETRAGMRRCEFYHGGFTRKNEAVPSLIDLLPQYRKYDKPNSLAKRLKAGTCELCGGQTNDVRIHHVRALKALTGKTAGELMMMQRRRKSLALCPMCFESEQYAQNPSHEQIESRIR